MPCSDSSSGINLCLSIDQRFVSFEFAKITCSSEIGGKTGYSDYCKGLSLEEILGQDFNMLVSALDLNTDQEQQFILYLEWEALRSAVVQYLGITRDDIDCSRAQVCSITQDENGIEVSLVIFPPADLPKIQACFINRG